jgi:4-diphosphocytidyl-2-C-methyl-D-erythritol kinase
MELSEKSYAKINLYLQILDKRPDGYHNLNTLFSKIDLYDVISIQESDNFSISCNDTSIPVDNKNIIWKVKDLIEKEKQIKINLDVKLDKKIPSGGGLGGGSSNAATFLKLVDKFYNMNLGIEKMSDILSMVGSDTVFFLYDKPMIGLSRGEILVKAPPIPKLDLLIINPGIFISTGQVFKDNNLRLTAKKEVIRMRQLLTLDELVNIMINDLERPVFTRFKIISELKDEIESYGAIKAMMSGSGSTLFGIFKDKDKLEFAYNYFENKYKDFFVMKTNTI